MSVFLTSHLPTRVHMSPPQALCENKRGAVWCGSEWWFLVCMKHAAILDAWWQTGLWLHLTLFSLTASSPWLYIPNSSEKQGGSCLPTEVYCSISCFPCKRLTKYMLWIRFGGCFLLWYCSLACWYATLKIICPDPCWKMTL